MTRPDVPPEVADKVEGCLEKLGDQGGTWRDVFRLTDLSESNIRGGFLTLERQERAYREPQFPGRGGRTPDVWRKGKKPEEEP